MTESEATNALLEILGDRLPQPIMRAIEENDRGGGSTRLVLPRPDRRDELFIQVIFAPRGVVALLKLGVLPEQVIEQQRHALHLPRDHLARPLAPGLLDPRGFEQFHRVPDRRQGISQFMSEHR